MAQLGNIPEIQIVKKQLDDLKEQGLVKEWEVPYEHLLTRLTAAVFFLTPSEPSRIEEVWSALGQPDKLNYRQNEEKKLSSMEWRLEYRA